VLRLMNSRVPISGLLRPFVANRTTAFGWGEAVPAAGWSASCASGAAGVVDRVPQAQRGALSHGNGVTHLAYPVNPRWHE
jgi:hypothetical protein